MITIKSKYEGGLRTTMEHVKSGNTMQTDAPVDNNGKGETFSPTDTVAAALGSCMMTVMAIDGEKNGIDMSGMRLEVTKVMSASPRRISALKVDFYWDGCTASKEDRAKLKEIGRNCPVALSLSESLRQEIAFHF
ncbi:OsmC family protein [Roseivirga pacifica]|uniref:OsmC family protein n=1 Tax=Roseivirga pacifica TaxID=1267423 RepID=UPI00227C2C33|nr:OsmC family protein [Roseivirga pacifica]